MDREIKFRAWDEVRGCLFHVDGIYFKGCYPGWEETSGCDISPGDHGEQEVYFSSPTLMQYTGLKDKNGQEIYEGDIVEFTWHKFENREPVRLRIFWDDDDHAWGASETLAHDQHETMGSRGSVWCLFREVIGNIYQNPELLND